VTEKKAGKIDLNPEFRRALALMEEAKQHVFVTGRAGTGKSTLLGYFRDERLYGREASLLSDGAGKKMKGKR
jgi:ABC-type lipoprotein export system ATPase subunit